MGELSDAKDFGKKLTTPKIQFSNRISIVLSIMILLIMLGLILCLKFKNNVINSYDVKVRNLNDELNSVKNTLLRSEKTVDENKNSTSDNSYVKTSCTRPLENATYTTDKKYYIQRHEAEYEICDRSNPESPAPIGRIEARMQNGQFLFITEYGYQMFIANLEKKTLEYFDINNFPDKDEYLNTDGSPDLWLFGPKEDDYNDLSPNKDKLIFGASNCHDCTTLIKNYVLDLNNLTITPLGVANSSAKWLDNNTVTWTEYYTRNKTQEEIENDPSGFPVVIEQGETKTKKL